MTYRNTQYGTTLRDAQAQVRLDRLSAPARGKVEIWTGPRPADAAAAPGVGTTKLGEKELADPVGAVAGGVLTYTAPGEFQVLATGSAQWYRVLRSDGTVEELGSAGRPGYAPDGITPEGGARYDMEFDSASLQEGATARINAWTSTIAEQVGEP